MLDTLLHIGPYAPILIFVASVLDIFFVTGLFLYGAAMLSSVFMLYTGGVISLEAIVVASYAGTVFGNTLNYGAGRYLRNWPLVQQRLAQPPVQKVQKFFHSRGLLLFMVVSRFMAITRPLYALVLGTLQVSFRRFIAYELLIALVWVVFWLIILVQGGSIYRYLFS